MDELGHARMTYREIDKIEVVLSQKPGPIDRPWERFYLSTIKHRLWRFFIPPANVVFCILYFGNHPVTWVMVGFLAAFLLFWTKAYLKYLRSLRAPFNETDETYDCTFVATRDGFMIDRGEDDTLIDWTILSRFGESRNFFAFTVDGYPTLTISKRHFSQEEADFVRWQSRKVKCA